MEKTEFKVLSDIQHILARPAMYVGSVDKGKFKEFILENDKFIQKEVEYVPAFLKIINEVLDNSVDVFIRTKGQYSTRIKLTFEKDSIVIEDNGNGIEVKQLDGKWIPELAWTQTKAGVNFNDERETIGMNGLGSVASAVFSLEFIGETCDGTNKCTVTCKNNCSEVETKVRTSTKQGTKVTFKPDLKRFKLKEKDVYSEGSIYQILMYQRLMSLSICYPGITFFFNGKQIKTSNLRSIMSLFGDTFEIIQGKNYVIGIFPNPDDEFKFFSYINGLRLSNGGSHIDIVTNDIVANVREKLSKRYKSIKPGEIKSKFFTVFYGWNFKNPKFDSQQKERLTNSTAEIREFLGNVDIEKFSKKVLANKSIIEPIVEIYKIKEEFAARKAIDKAAVTKPEKVVDKKYLPPTGKNKYLLLTEGNSARVSVSAVLGRSEFGYFELRGVPISAEKSTLLRFLENAEIKLLGRILGIDFSKTPKLMQDSENWYEMDDGTIVNENDLVLIDGKWILVSKLLQEVK